MTTWSSVSIVYFSLQLLSQAPLQSPQSFSLHFIPHFNFVLHFIAIFVGWSLLALLDEISADTEVAEELGVAATGNDNVAVSAATDNLDKLIFMVFPLKYVLCNAA